jgi:hypothetical protein
MSEEELARHETLSILFYEHYQKKLKRRRDYQILHQRKQNKLFLPKTDLIRSTPKFRNS